jgi:hypothetical protein
LIDTALSAANPNAMNIHALIERWVLEVVPLPGRLVHQIIDWLYRDNRLFRGTLEISGKRVGPSGLTVPTFAVVNVSDEVAPLSSMKPFIDAIPTKTAQCSNIQERLGLSAAFRNSGWTISSCRGVASNCLLAESKGRRSGNRVIMVPVALYFGSI